jgi:TonB family protein
MITLAKSVRPSLGYMWYALPLLAVSGVALLLMPKRLVALGVAALIVLAVGVCVTALTIYGQTDLFVLGWVLIFPLGYYYLTWWRGASKLMSLDRGFIGLLIVAMIVGFPHAGKFLPGALKKTAVAWGFFLAAAFVSLRNLENPLGGTKQLIDAFILPGLLAYYVIRYFRLREWLPTIHVLTCVMALYVALIGAVELWTGQDLLPIPSGVFISEETGTLSRVNGPFASNASFGLIGLITLWFLVFLGRALADRVTGWMRVLHVVGLAAAFAIAVMPMFRSMVATLVLVFILELCSTKKASVRVGVVTLILIVAASFLLLRMAAPELFTRRVADLGDLYARIAQQKQTLDMFRSNPINGVGLANYSQGAAQLPDAFYTGVASVGWAHNNLAAVLAETGLTGFVPYLLAQLYFFRSFWTLRKRRSPDAILAATFFLYVFFSYWINGLMLTSGYESDLNFWYLFVTAVLYKFAVTGRSELSIPEPLHPRLLNLRPLTAGSETWLSSSIGETCRSRSDSVYTAMPRTKLKRKICEPEHEIAGTAGQPISAVLASVVERACSLMCGDGAAIALCDSQGVLCQASTGDAPDVGSRLQPDSGFTRACFETGQELLCDDAQNDSRVRPSAAISLHLRSAVAVPIHAEGHILGVVEVFSSRPSAFDTTHVAELQRIADSLALLLAAQREQPVTGCRSLVAAQVESPFSIKEQQLAQQALNPDPPVRMVDSQPTMGAEEGKRGPSSPAVATGILPQLAGRTPSRGRLAAAGVALLLVCIFAESHYRSRKAPSGDAVPPRASAARPGDSVVGSRARAGDTVETHNLKTSKPSSRAKVSPPTAATSSSTAEEEGELSSSQLRAMPVEPGRALAFTPFPQSGGRRAAAQTDSKTPAEKGDDTEVAGPASPALIVEGAPPGAQSFVDDQLTFSIDSDGRVKISRLAPGKNSLRLGEHPPPAARPATDTGQLVRVLSVPATLPQFAGPISQGFSGGVLVHKVQPIYPRQAVPLRLEGSVLLQATVAENGAIRDLKVTSGHPMLARAAIEAVSEWRYRPFLLNGKPIQKQVDISIDFKMPK